MCLQKISSNSSTGQDEWSGVGVGSTSELSWLARTGCRGRDRRNGDWSAHGYCHTFVSTLPHVPTYRLQLTGVAVVASKNSGSHSGDNGECEAHLDCDCGISVVLNECDVLDEADVALKNIIVGS